MGGTAMVFTGLSIGIILSVSRGEREENWGQKTASEELRMKEKNMDAKAA
jgi:cell division protein FtsW